MRRILAVIAVIVVCAAFCSSQVIVTTAGINVDNLFTGANSFTQSITLADVACASGASSKTILCSDTVSHRLKFNSNNIGSLYAVGTASGVAGRCVQFATNGIDLVDSGSASCGGLTTPLTLQTNSTPNGSQSLLNLIQGSNVTITDNGTGGVTIASTGGGGGVTGSGSTNTLPLWTGSTALGDSNFSQNGTTMNLSSHTLAFTGTIGRLTCPSCTAGAPALAISASSNFGDNHTHIDLYDDAGSGGTVYINAGGATGGGLFRIISNGTVGWTIFPSSTLTNIPSAVNGSVLYCTDCHTVTNPCSTSGGTGTGTFAFKVNGAWNCPF